MHQIVVLANFKRGRSRLKWIGALFLAFLFFVSVFLVGGARLKGPAMEARTAIRGGASSNTHGSSKWQHERQGLQPLSPATHHHDASSKTQQNGEQQKRQRERDRLCGYRWNGEFIRDEKTMKGGSCFCGKDEYCVCSPSLAIDCIVEIAVDRGEKGEDENGIVMEGSKKGAIKGTEDMRKEGGTSGKEMGLSTEERKQKKGSISTAGVAVAGGGPRDAVGNADVMIVLVFRKDPPRGRYAIPGGFVQIGESAEDATVREVLEETNITVSREALEQFRLYSHPTRDPRRHTASMVFRYRAAEAHETLKRPTLLQHMSAGDDAKAVKVVSLVDALNRSKLTMAFDHREILEDYARRYYPHLL